MADVATPPNSERDLLVAFVLGTFHAAAFIIILLVVVYPTGGLAPILTGLNTTSGLALFIALWFTTTWSARRALRGLLGERLKVALPTGTVIARAARRGGINGVAFLLLVFVILAVPAVLTGGILPILLGGLLPAIFGLGFAFVIGALVGLTFAGVDTVLLLAARALLN